MPSMVAICFLYLSFPKRLSCLEKKRSLTFYYPWCFAQDFRMEQFYHLNLINSGASFLPLTHCLNTCCSSLQFYGEGYALWWPGPSFLFCHMHGMIFSLLSVQQMPLHLSRLSQGSLSLWSIKWHPHPLFKNWHLPVRGSPPYHVNLKYNALYTLFNMKCVISCRHC